MLHLCFTNMVHVTFVSPVLYLCEYVCDIKANFFRLITHHTSPSVPQTVNNMKVVRKRYCIQYTVYIIQYMYTAYSIQYIHVPNACNDYDQSCSNEACAAGFVWGPNKWLAFVFAPVEPVEIYLVRTEKKTL